MLRHHAPFERARVSLRARLKMASFNEFCSSLPGLWRNNSEERQKNFGKCLLVTINTIEWSLAGKSLSNKHGRH